MIDKFEYVKCCKDIDRARAKYGRSICDKYHEFFCSQVYEGRKYASEVMSIREFVEANNLYDEWRNNIENDPAVLAVNYQEWLENVYNPDWSGWNTVSLIEMRCGKSRAYPDDWLGHSICFLNNYLLELKTAEVLGNVRFKGDDHLYWFGYKGEDIADFERIDDGVSIEVKQMKESGSLLTIPDKDWHGADVCLAYFRTNSSLNRFYPETGRYELLLHFKADRIHREEITVNEEIQAKALSLRGRFGRR